MTDTGTITNVDITQLTDIHTITYNRLGSRTVRWANVYKYLLNFFSPFFQRCRDFEIIMLHNIDKPESNPKTESSPALSQIQN